MVDAVTHLVDVKCNSCYQTDGTTLLLGPLGAAGAHQVSHITLHHMPVQVVSMTLSNHRVVCILAPEVSAQTQSIVLQPVHACTGQGRLTSAHLMAAV